MKKVSFIWLATLIVPPFLSAHYIWLEYDEKDEARVYYGEIQDGEREKSPGKLDKIKGLKIWIADRNAAVKEMRITKTAEFFSAPGINSALYVLAVSKDVPVTDMKKYNRGMAKPMYYARYGPRLNAAAAKPVHALDILPVAGSENEFQVFFNGVPLVAEKLMVYAPNTWMQEFKTDGSGKVKLATPWGGQYVIEVIHTDKAPGSFEGKAYENVRHRATYTFVKK